MSRMPEYRRQLVRDLRQRQTQSEALLWEELRGRKLQGLKFRRQRPLGRYIADFCCDALKLVVELDGGIHQDPDHQEYDQLRDELMQAHGYTILCLDSEAVMSDLLSALARIREAAEQCHQ